HRDRLAALGWWATERVASVVTESLQAAGIETAPALRDVLNQFVISEAAITEVEWGMLPPTGAPSTFAFGTMEARGLWATALLATPDAGVPLALDDEPWVALTLLK